MSFLASDNRRDLGLLLLRVGTGAMFIAAHGFPKLMGGPALWVKVGGAMSLFGLTFAPAMWGFFAMAAELVGGILLILGKWVRPASAAMLGTMIVASHMHLRMGDGLAKSSSAIEAGVVFLALIFLGGGRYALDSRRG